MIKLTSRTTQTEYILYIVNKNNVFMYIYNRARKERGAGETVESLWHEKHVCGDTLLLTWKASEGHSKSLWCLLVRAPIKNLTENISHAWKSLLAYEYILIKCHIPFKRIILPLYPHLRGDAQLTYSPRTWDKFGQTSWSELKRLIFSFRRIDSLMN